jgi:hypothetical protein
MAGLTLWLKTNTWLAIAVSAVATIALGLLHDWQTAAFLACVLGCLMMWKSEIDHPTVHPDVLEEA